MVTFDIISVAVQPDYLPSAADLGEKCAEVERYMYGRYFRMDASKADSRGIVRVFWLVESHYAHAIIDRLASGLIWASMAEPGERDALGF